MKNVLHAFYLKSNHELETSIVIIVQHYFEYIQKGINKMYLWNHLLGRINKKYITKYPIALDFGNHLTISLMINAKLVYQDR